MSIILFLLRELLSSTCLLSGEGHVSLSLASIPYLTSPIRRKEQKQGMKRGTPKFGKGHYPRWVLFIQGAGRSLMKLDIHEIKCFKRSC